MPQRWRQARPLASRQRIVLSTSRLRARACTRLWLARKDLGGRPARIRPVALGRAAIRAIRATLINASAVACAASSIQSDASAGERARAVTAPHRVFVAEAAFLSVIAAALAVEQPCERGLRTRLIRPAEAARVAPGRGMPLAEELLTSRLSGTKARKSGSYRG
jgi:hypothetical protein